MSAMVGQVALGTAAAAAGILTWAVRGRASSLLAPSVWRGSPDQRAIALTFDDGPSESTAAVLEMLERHGARATFFACGFHVRRLPVVARQVVASGHEIANHTQNHAALYLRSPNFIDREVGLAQRTIEDVTGATPTLFRAPYGARWFGLRSAQRHHGLLGVMWTAIARDWTLSGQAIARRLRNAAKPGAILCFHDARALSRNPDITATLDSLGRLLPIWKEQGFAFWTVSQLLCLPS
jgi:peptidoglycan-N-acetylglucosamine deacetylase